MGAPAAKWNMISFVVFPLLLSRLGGSPHTLGVLDLLRLDLNIAGIANFRSILTV
jgi:hypothetical protein